MSFKVLQTSLSTSASDTSGKSAEVDAFAMCILPAKATFSAQCSLTNQAFGPTGSFPIGRATAYIERYITVGPGGELNSTLLGEGTCYVNSVADGYAVTFGVAAAALNAVTEASAVGTVFI